MKNQITHASLCSGIGGFDLAASWKGWQNIFQVENDEECKKVLKKHFPETARFGDIFDFDGVCFKGKIDVLSAGFPCQPFSVEGHRRGESDERFLWPEVYRVIGEVRPGFFVGENVSGIKSMENGRTIARIQNDLEGLGYKVQCFLLPTAAIEGWMQRERCFILAYTNSVGFKEDWGVENKQPHSSRQRDAWQQIQFCRTRGGMLRPIPNSGICRVANGLPSGLHRYHQLGNAVVPQLAFAVFNIIEEFMISQNEK